MGETVDAIRTRSEICALCGHFKMKEYPEHAKVGLGRCAGRAARVDVIAPFPPWKSPACGRYTPAANIGDRHAWIEKRQVLEQNTNAAQTSTKG